VKGDTQDHLPVERLAAREILDEIRSDRELIERLNISRQELEALSKCGLLGTLTCKQDMLFILRLIREATIPAIDQATVPQPLDTLQDLDEEDPEPDFSRIPVRIAVGIPPEPGSSDGVVRSRVHVHFGVLFLTLFLVGVFVWNGVKVMSRWRDNFNSAAQSLFAYTSHSNLDRFNVLLSGEILFVAGLAVWMYLKSHSGTRRLKVRPNRRFRLPFVRGNRKTLAFLKRIESKTNLTGENFAHIDILPK